MTKVKVPEWQIVPECDAESGTHTCWAREINHKSYGRYVWITAILDCDEKTIMQYNVEVIPDTDVRTLAKRRSLSSAKRWVTINL